MDFKKKPNQKWECFDGYFELQNYKLHNKKLPIIFLKYCRFL